jgi:hypothetical protein
MIFIFTVSDVVVEQLAGQVAEYSDLSVSSFPECL